LAGQTSWQRVSPWFILPSPPVRSHQARSLMKPPSPPPVLPSAWREAMMVFAIWGAAGTWCVMYAALYGYNRTTADLTFVLGFPDWIFWGLVVPWVTCVVISAIVSQFLMRD